MTGLWPLRPSHVVLPPMQPIETPAGQLSFTGGMEMGAGPGAAAGLGLCGSMCMG
jgi:hypothetical protein